MNVLMITDNDPAGMGIAFRNAIVRHTHHHCRLITTTTKYNFNFEKDLHVPDLTSEGFEEIRDLLISADIIHFHVLADENLKLGPITPRDYVRGKTMVHHHHGHPHFRAHPEIYRDKYRMLRRKALVSTPDLLRLLPESAWQPNLVPIHEPLFLPEPTPLNERFVIGQSVTRKELKNTEKLLEVIGKIRRRLKSPEVLAEIIEHTDYRDCLKRKRRCHVIFDHMQGYYGVSSLESLSQGKPVIAGLDDWNLYHIREFAGTSSIPWILCRTGEDLEKTIQDLAGETDRVEKLGKESREFMCAHWSDKKAVDRLMDFYRSC